MSAQNANQFEGFEQIARHLDPSWVNGKWKPKSMTLDTIKNSQDRKDRFLKVTNLISDIPGAQPKQLKNFNKPHLHSTSDIEGAHPRRLHKKLNKKSFYNVADIDGAKPATRTFHSRRCVDPLSPKYKLPSFEVPDPPVPKFIRDHVDFSDVDGTRPRKHHERKVRDIMRVSDIDGAKPSRWLRPPFSAITSRYDPVSHSRSVSDINQASGKVKAGTNSLRPVYVINDMRIEDEEYTYPRKGKTALHPCFVLRTDDIQGATPGLSIDCFQHMPTRRHYRRVNDVSDVEGARADTLHRGLRSKRSTDPLNPRYRYLDGNFSARPSTTAGSARPAQRSSARPSTRHSAPTQRSSARPSTRHSARSRGSWTSESACGNQSPEPIARSSSAAALDRVPRGARDNLRCGGLGMVPTSGDFEPPHGRAAAAYSEAVADHFQEGMTLEAEVERLHRAGVFDNMDLKADHLAPNLIPDHSEDEFKHKPGNSGERRDSIGSWARWSGEPEAAAPSAAQASARSDAARKQGQSAALPQEASPQSSQRSRSGRQGQPQEASPQSSQRSRSGRKGTDDGEEVNGSISRRSGVESAASHRSSGSLPRPGTAVGSGRSRRRSLGSHSSRSTGSLRGKDAGSLGTCQSPHFHLNIPHAGSSSSRSWARQSNKPTAKEQSQRMLDEKSVADLPDTVVPTTRE